jgi:putative CocE/NonD family hydrolase
LTAASRALARLIGLRPADTEEVGVERDLPMSADGDATLLSDHWFPTGGTPLSDVPIVLLRSPYGRRQLGPVARLFAERGYQVVIQSCRGTFGSGGGWEPFRNEQADGHRALDWLATQPWWSGRVATFGASYLGLTQWAVIADPPPSLQAAALNVTTSRFRDAVVFPGGSFTLETGATWMYLLEHQELGWRHVIAAQMRARRGMAGAYTTLPLAAAESAVLGRRVDYYQDWLLHDRPGDPWWDVVDFGRDLSKVPPTTHVGGWYDIFLPAQLADYQSLVAAGRKSRLTIGPWTHASPRGLGTAVRDGLEWFDGHLRDDRGALRPLPVRLFVLGRERWVDLAAWPPPALPTRWYLRAGGGLGRETPVPSAPDAYRWDPADPTPGSGGASLNAATAGPRPQREREERDDVLTFTSDALPVDLTVAGPLRAEIWLRSSNWNTDLFVRLCDVAPSGRSLNLSDGILRLEPDGAGVSHLGSAADGDVSLEADGTVRVGIRMWPTAVMFRRGHRIRVQVSGGAHPLFARNLGGGESLGEGTKLVVADHEIFHDPEHPSAIELPHSSI